MTDKSPDAFRTISEVGVDLDLPQHVLRFWETRFSQIRPLKRSGGRRYYRPEDVDLLKAIRHLLYGQGYTIKGVQRILKEQGVKAVIVQALNGGAGVVSSIPAPDGHASDGDGEDFTDVEHAGSKPDGHAGAGDHTKLSFEDAHRLKAALFELNEGLRLLRDALKSED